MFVTQLILKRLRYVCPVLRAVLCLAVSLTLTGRLERGRAGTKRTAVALTKVHEAAELVSELRFGSFEQLALRGNDPREAWLRLEPQMEALDRDRVYTSQEGRAQLRRTSALFESARETLSPAAAKEVAVEGMVVWAGWHRVETSLTQRLARELAGPGDQAAVVNLLAALGCLSCAFLLWQTWQVGQLREDAGVVESRSRESESRYRAMAELSIEKLIQADLSGKILRSNHKLSETDMASLFDSPETWTRTVASMKSAPAGPSVSACQVRVSGNKDGRLMEWRATPVWDASGAIVRIDSALLDITSWQEAQRIPRRVLPSSNKASGSSSYSSRTY